MKVLLACSLLLAVALSGCSGDDGGGGDAFETPEQDEQGRYIIRMNNFEFVPEQAEVPVGSTVVWINEEGSHNVVPQGHSQWSATTVSGSTGVHLEATLDETGTFPYFCQPHRAMGMEATIRVV